MQLKIESTIVGNELIDIFLKQLKANNIEAKPEDIKILVTTKKRTNDENRDSVVELTPDRISLSYTKTQV